jgi:hypothetical protein
LIENIRRVKKMSQFEDKQTDLETIYARLRAEWADWKSWLELADRLQEMDDSRSEIIQVAYRLEHAELSNIEKTRLERYRDLLESGAKYEFNRRFFRSGVSVSEDANHGFVSGVQCHFYDNATVESVVDCLSSDSGQLITLVELIGCDADDVRGLFESKAFEKVERISLSLEDCPNLDIDRFAALGNYGRLNLIYFDLEEDKPGIVKRLTEPGYLEHRPVGLEHPRYFTCRPVQR